MSKFKDMVARDNARTFMNLDEFAEKRIVVYDGVTYDGEDHAGIPVVLSGLKEKDRRQLMRKHDVITITLNFLKDLRVTTLCGHIKQFPPRQFDPETVDPDCLLSANPNLCHDD